MNCYLWQTFVICGRHFFAAPSKLDIPAFFIDGGDEPPQLCIRRSCHLSPQISCQVFRVHHQRSIWRRLFDFNKPPRQDDNRLNLDIFTGLFRQNPGQPLRVALRLRNGFRVLTVRELQHIAKNVNTVRGLLLAAPRPHTVASFCFDKENSRRTNDNVINISILFTGKIMKGTVAAVPDLLQCLCHCLFASQSEAVFLALSQICRNTVSLPSIRKPLFFRLVLPSLKLLNQN